MLVFKGDHVFTTGGGHTPVSGFSKAKTALDVRLGDISPWRFQDMRRSFATHLEELGIARPVISSLLNHAGASVTDIYTRSGLATERREVIERLGALFEGTDRPVPAVSNVVRLRP